ncbi:uncharacterized protein LOC130629266 isoform X1 [Hydractinia symbiolongicarpus]|uniref:uncharacterized protein LOC130629266 isoform X1 n=1 Tax=Hydractinia symbiolongicarpus TaxID=13093 RepID=UPI00254D9A1F|nr:uncharacterized protein LOC130629266 isoform X1 [Hydractinia symbiolongicarpus]
MLYSKICGDEANSSATQCVLCKDYVDVKCHGGVVGDGHVVCKECTGNLDEITSGTISKEELVIEGVSKFNSKLIKEVVESKSLKLIFSGQLYSHRHNTFKKGGKHKRNMDDTCVLDLLSDGQRELIISQIMHHFGKESEMHDYYVKVLLPEAVILLLAKSMRWSRVKAEVFLGLYLQERNKDDAENLEHQSTFVGMVKEGMRNYQRQKSWLTCE